MSARQPLYYTFGNHMHWVDMQWLWGYDVLPGSVRDMLRLCRETGAKGSVNFDAVGYEKMAADSPDALAELREAVRAGTVEPVGCSFGQPYGLFHGGESNVRQFTYGVRSTRRLLGVRPRTFWEEEFYFYPQLPQVLRSSGFTGSCLFFQWTWHTPELPREVGPLILWEGIDGSRLPALPRNELNVHQWPEDFDGLLDKAAAVNPERPPGGGTGAARSMPPAVVQWLELMPSRDWMCRSEVLLPRLKELMGDPRFDIRSGTAGDVIAELTKAAHGADAVPARRYRMDDVWHGMTLGKNGDRHPRTSRKIEERMLAVESISALAGILGRPYANWDVYPTWELDEAWRELLSAQHHDNHECEGLCGTIGYHSFNRAASIIESVDQRTLSHISDGIGGEGVSGPFIPMVVFNRLGWPRDMLMTADDGRPPIVVRDVPPFGYRVAPTSSKEPRERITVTRDRKSVTLSRQRLSVTIDTQRGVITQIKSAQFPDGILSPGRPLAVLSMVRDDGPEEFDSAGGARVEIEEVGGVPCAMIVRQGRDGAALLVRVQIVALQDAISIHFDAPTLPRPKPGFGGALKTSFGFSFKPAIIRVDQPYSVENVKAEGTFKRKYPTGDWMTSPQWFEDVQRPFTARTFVDLLREDEEGPGVLVVHNGSQQWFRDADGRGVNTVLSAYDPWDEKDFFPELSASFTIIPHSGTTDAERYKAGRTSGENWTCGPSGDGLGVFPRALGLVGVEGAPGVVLEAACRESMKAGEHLPEWAGHRMFAETGGACTHPMVLRLVEWNGHPGEVVVKLPGPLGLVAKTNLLGEVGPGVGGGGADTGWLTPEPATPPAWAHAGGNPLDLRGRPLTWSQVRFRVRPREIVTVMADVVLARKEFRDLDAKREIWATVHKVDEVKP